MREPATSCTTCGAALLPAEVLYSRQAEVVCAACFGDVPEPGLTRARRWWGRGRAVAVCTPHERRGAILRWSLLFAILAASTLQVRHFALIRLHMICPHVSIDGPAAGAAVTSHLVVHGHVAGTTVTRPLWVVARAAAEREGCLHVRMTPVITDPFGLFAVALELPGRRGQRYAVSVVSVDRVVDGAPQAQPDWPHMEARPRDTQQQGGLGRRCRWRTLAQGGLPEGAAVLASVEVILGDDPRPSSVAPRVPSAFPTLNDDDVLDAERE